MKREAAKQRIEKLRELIDKYRYSKHVLDKEEVPADIEDSFKKELFDLEQKFPELITPDSPTQRVAGKPLKKFEKVRHPKPMLSFNDAFSQKDMTDWLERILKLLTKKESEKISFYCEPKIDGLAIELIYEKGVLKTGSTRGDGIIGEDVTQNLKTIEAVPLKLKTKNLKENIPEKIVVRGEVVVSRQEFEKINRERFKKNLPPFANPRNMAAGSIRQLDPKIASKRRLDFIAYDLLTDLNQETHQREHEILQLFGFKANEKYNKHCKNLKEVFEFHSFWQKNRKKLPYDIDGLVVTVNDNKVFEELGVVGKAPRGAIAFKFPLKQAITVIEDILVQVGRTGAVTPVAALRPVEVGGVKISRATLHNEDEIKKLGVKIGDTVVVGRAGDVIPDIVKVLPEMRTGKEKNFIFPKKCPVCQKKLIRTESEAVWRCSDTECFARQKEHIYHFVSKKAFDMVGLGPRIVNKLISKKLVSDPADLFFLKEGDILSLEGFAEKSANNLIKSIQSKKEIVFSRFIYALGIRNVGEETARYLADNFITLKGLKEARLEDLEKVNDIGPVTAENIYLWFRDKKNLEFLEKLEKSGIRIINDNQRIKSSKLKGLTFALTGTLKSVTREKAGQTIRQLGGEVSGSVSKKIDFLIIGKDPGSKRERARELGIKIISEKEFLNMVK